MRKLVSALEFTTLMSLAGAMSLAGCTDVGDSSSGEGPSDAGSSVDATNPVDAQTSDDATSDDSTAEGAAATGAEPSPEAESDDGASLGEPADSGSTQPPEDSSAPEGEEAGGPDASPEAGTSVADSSVADTGAPEAGPADSGTQEGGAIDSGVADAGTVDAGHDAGVVADSGVADAGGDAGSAGGHDAGALVPCTTPNQTGCVQCVGSLNSPTCTPTEALIVAHDIANGNLDATGQLKAYVGPANTGSCYTCLNEAACLDDNNMDTGNECADTLDLTGAAAGSGVTQCLTTLRCILGSDCQGPGALPGTSANSSQENVQLCYCGGNNAGSVCSTAGTATNGLCVTQEAAGFGFAFSDNKDILANYGSQLFPSGSANAIFQCAASNKCTLCE
jgi:hypothetical protein